MTDNLPAKYERELETFVLPKELDNLDGLLQFEGEVISSAATLSDAMDRFGFHLHIILENRMWRHHKTSDGQPSFDNQQEYLEWLAVKSRTGVSTMKSYHSACRFGRAIGLTDVKQISEVGLPMLVEVSDYVVTDRNTGEPLRLKYGQPPEGKEIKEYLREAVSDFASRDFVPPHEKRKELGRVFAPGRPRVQFDILDPRLPGNVIWVAEMWDKDGMLVEIPGNYGPITSKTPQFVLQEWYKRLGVDWKEEYR